MNPDQKSLVLGILVGVMVSFLVFGGGTLIWERLSCPELKVFADQTASITIEDKTLNFEYNSSSGMINYNGGSLGFGGLLARDGVVLWGSSWGDCRVIEANPDYVVLLFRPSIITRMDGLGGATG